VKGFIGTLINNELEEVFIVGEKIAMKDFKSLIVSWNLYSVMVGLDGKMKPKPSKVDASGLS
jgi:hypothetical protein